MILGIAAVMVAPGLLTILGSLVNLILAIGLLKAADEDRLAWHDQWSGTGVFRIVSDPTA